jgi:hypothetical protein
VEYHIPLQMLIEELQTRLIDCLEVFAAFYSRLSFLQ